MPAFILPAIIAGGAAVGAAAIAGTAITLATFMVPAAITLAAGVASQALARQPQSADLASESRARSVIVRSAVEPHRVVYGEVITSGPMLYAESESDGTFHMIVGLAGHEVDAIGDAWFDDNRVGGRDAGGVVTAGTYANLARIKTHLGTDSQTADADLVAESAGKWTTDHRLRGIAYAYVRLSRNDTAYPTGLPNVRLRVRGRKCYDPRDGQTRWTNNPALVARDILTSAWGLNATDAEIDDTLVAASANVCDERVAVTSYTSSAVTVNAAADLMTFAADETRIGTGDGVRVLSTGSMPGNISAGVTYYAIRTDERGLKLATTYADALLGTARDITSAGSGTITVEHMDQARYTCNGTFTRDMAPIDILQHVCAAMGGPAPIYREGKWRIYAGAWTVPTVTLTEDDLRGPVRLQVSTPRAELFNAVRGTYAPSWQSVATDWPPYEGASYIAEDGETIYTDLQLLMVDNAVRAQRIAKLHLERARRAEVLTLQCKLTALRIACWDTVYVTSPTLGYSAKTFRVTDWRLTSDEGGLGVDLLLQEEDANVYAWASNEADTPPVVTLPALPDPRQVNAPTLLTFASGTAQLLKGSDGTIVSRLRASWTPPVNENLDRFEVQWKQSSEASYNSEFLPRTATRVYLAPVQDGVEYTVRVRAYTTLGTVSDWVTGTHTVLGKTAPPTAPTQLTATGSLGGVDLVWDECPDADYWTTEIYESATNDRATASRATVVTASRFSRSGLPGGATRYYWVRNIDTSGNVSAWYPASPTGGIGATAQAGASIPVVGTLPGVAAEGDVVYLNTDDKLYRYDGSGWVTWVDGSDILAASITAGKLATKTITAASAVIDDAAINTLQIAGQAVTVPVSSSSTLAFVHGGGWSGTQLTCAITATGAPILVLAQVVFYSPNLPLNFDVAMAIRVRRNGNIISAESWSPGVGQYATGSCLLVMVDTPAAGAQTYTLELFSGGVAQVVQRTMLLLETKR